MHFIMIHHQSSDSFYQRFFRLPYTNPLNLFTSIWGYPAILSSVQAEFMFFEIKSAFWKLIKPFKIQSMFFKAHQPFLSLINIFQPQSKFFQTQSSFHQLDELFQHQLSVLTFFKHFSTSMNVRQAWLRLQKTNHCWLILIDINPSLCIHEFNSALSIMVERRISWAWFSDMF